MIGKKKQTIFFLSKIAVNLSLLSPFCQLLSANSYMNRRLQMPAIKTTAYNIRPIEIGVLLAKITYIKSHSKVLVFCLQTDMK